MRICINCNEREAKINHHTDYEKDITVPVCYKCHFHIHRNKDNKYYPINQPVTLPLIRKMSEYNGQYRIVIPKAIAQSMQIKNRDPFEIIIERGDIILRKI